MMLIDLPPLEETVAGKELIQVAEARGEARGEKRGEARGEARGICATLLGFCEARFQRLPVALRKQILLLKKPTAQALVAELNSITSVAELKEWLANHTDPKPMNGSARRKK